MPLTTFVMIAVGVLGLMSLGYLAINRLVDDALLLVTALVELGLIVLAVVTAVVHRQVTGTGEGATMLAYALTLEEAGGAAALETLPFVLDEALTTSDPSRFAQVAGAVLDIVEASGRQFVYLSARPEDADLWRRAAASRPRAPLAVIALAGSAVPAEGAAV